MLRSTTPLALLVVALMASAAVATAASKTRVAYLTPGCKSNPARQADVVQACAKTEVNIRVGGLPGLIVNQNPPNANITTPGPYVNVGGTAVVNNLKVLGNFSANIQTGSSLPDGTITGQYLYWNQTARKWTVGSSKVNIGAGAVADPRSPAIAIGENSNCPSWKGVCIGTGISLGSAPYGDNAVVMHHCLHRRCRKADDVVAIGRNAGVQKSGSVSIGLGAYCEELYTVAVGAASVARGQGAVSIAPQGGVFVGASNGVAVGFKARVSNSAASSIAIGEESRCDVTNAIAVGKKAAMAYTGIVLSTSGTGLAPAAAGFYVDAVRNKATAGTLGLYWDSTTNEIYAAPEAVRRRRGLQGDEGEAAHERIAALEAKVAELEELVRSLASGKAT